MTKLFKVTYCNPEMIKYWLDQYFAVFIKPDPEELSKNIKKYGRLGIMKKMTKQKFVISTILICLRQD